jgi:hypothetical protein
LILNRRLRRHSVFELAPGLLLVFKPRGHREVAHAHPHGQRLRVLRGRLAVSTARGGRELTPSVRPMRIAAGRRHATRALADTWLIAERLGVSAADQTSRGRARGPRSTVLSPQVMGASAKRRSG